MIPAILDAQSELEADGLEVRPSGENSLWIAATTKHAPGGITISKDVSALLRTADGWVATFPADGMLCYEVPGDLECLLGLIRTVYSRYRGQGGSLKDAFRASISEPDSYLAGRFPPENIPAEIPSSGRAKT